MAKYLDLIRHYLSEPKASRDYDEAFAHIANCLKIQRLNTNSQIQLIEPNQLNHYYENGYFLFKSVGDKTCIAISNLEYLKQNLINNFLQKQIFLIHKKDFASTLCNISAEFNSKQAVHYLQNNTRFHSAKTVDYNKMVTGFMTLFFALMVFYITLFNLINNIFYFLQNSLKTFLFATGRFCHNKHSSLDRNNLPLYSVLIPLYKEEIKAEAILKAIHNLDYPKDKLDVKLIIEEDDITTIKAIAVLDIPAYVQVIKVPYSFPRTKPKALNYAIPFVRGQYLTIYDAEDEPEKLQLLKAVTAFHDLPPEYACVQARLNFYNANENWLSKLFSIEYSVWFDYLLKGLSILMLPVTLGGTSNHFKVDVLKKVGLWDAYNVTEDADLGIRLYLSGYKVHMIDSVTMEEAPTNVPDWLAQRARWIKGFIQTLAVFMKTRIDHRVFSKTQICVVYIFVGLSTYSFIFLPWLLLLLVTNLSANLRFLWLINSLCAVFYMYITAYTVMSRENSLVKLNSIKNYLVFFCWPFYFILHTIAAYRSLWEVIKAPFQWNKTPHGSYDKLKLGESESEDTNPPKN